MNEIIQAVTILKAGGLVAFPTETVYGLGADANNPEAVSKVFAAKGRPADHPLIVHLARLEQLSKWAQVISPLALRLAKAFWPGPLTLVFKKQPEVLDCVTGGQDTVAIRIPSHPLALALLDQFDDGVVAPSANQFTRLSPTEAVAVTEELGERVDLVLDGGSCAVGLESTIVDVSGDVPTILRPGMITQKMIADVIDMNVSVRDGVVATKRVPGQHYLHYAPMTKTVLFTKIQMQNWLRTLATDAHVAVMVHSDIEVPVHERIHVVKMPNQASAYAQALYQTLRCLDRGQLTAIAIEEVPKEAPWEAIHDRLGKATGSRSIS